MPRVLLPSWVTALLPELRGVFTRPSFENFTVLVAGALHALGKHHITDALRAAGRSADKHFTTYFRLFSQSRWCLDQLGLVWLGILLRLFPAAKVELVLDDTLFRRSGKKVALATMHADPLLKQGGKPFMSYGHVFVVLSIHLSLPSLWRTGWALPFMFRLYQGKRVGGRADSPSDKRRALSRRRDEKKTRTRSRLTDREVVDNELRPCVPKPEGAPRGPESPRPTKLQLAAEMVIAVAKRFPNVRFRVLADHLYCGHDLLHVVHEAVDNVSFVVRGLPDAALYDLPAERVAGQRGRPAVRGERLLAPAEWAKVNAGLLERATVDIYGHDVPIRFGSLVGMPYRSLPGRLARYVIVQDPDGIYKEDYLLTTDPLEEATTVIQAFSHRWPLERTFQECKQKLGCEHPEVQRPESVRRVVPFLMFLYGLVVAWYLADGRTSAAHLGRPPDAWYPTPARPSFTHMLAAFRRASWEDAFVDPSSDTPSREQTMAEYLARVVAAA